MKRGIEQSLGPEKRQRIENSNTSQRGYGYADGEPMMKRDTNHDVDSSARDYGYEQRDTSMENHGRFRSERPRRRYSGDRWGNNNRLHRGRGRSRNYHHDRRRSDRHQLQSELFVGGLKPFSFFQKTLEDGVGFEEGQKLYAAYKKDYIRRRSDLFFDEQQNSGWFREQYHPAMVEASNQDLVSRCKSSCASFMESQGKPPALEEDMAQRQLRILEFTEIPAWCDSRYLEQCMRKATEESIEEIVLGNAVPSVKFHRCGRAIFGTEESARKAQNALSSLRIECAHPLKGTDRNFFELKIEPSLAPQRASRSSPFLPNRLSHDLKNCIRIVEKLHKERQFDDNVLKDLMQQHEGAGEKHLFEVLLRYLRTVHFFCFFCVERFNTFDELVSGCALNHVQSKSDPNKSDGATASQNKSDHESDAASDPLSSSDPNESDATSALQNKAEHKSDAASASQKKSEHETTPLIHRAAIEHSMAEDWASNLDKKIETFLDTPHNVPERSAERRIAEAQESWLRDNFTQVTENRFRCTIDGCRKQFVAENFIRKHLQLKHSALLERKLDAARKLQFFRNYMDDPNRIISCPQPVFVQNVGEELFQETHRPSGSGGGYPHMNNRFQPHQHQYQPPRHFQERYHYEAVPAPTVGERDIRAKSIQVYDDDFLDENEAEASDLRFALPS